MELHATEWIPTDPVHEDTDGWWFWDETWVYRHGPFTTEQVARAELDSYAAALHRVHEFHRTHLALLAEWWASLDR
jgi:hypothetical protein